MALGLRALRHNPVDFPSRILGIPSEWVWDGVQRMILSVFKHRKTAVQAGHAMSKDWTAGVLAIEWMLLHFGRAKVICTGPGMQQVKEVMFTEIEGQYERLRARFPEFKKDWFSSKKLDFGPQCFATGLTPKDVKGMVGRFQGFHSPNMLVIITEAQAVDPSVFKQLRGLMTSPNCRVLELGNPLVNFGDFYEHCTNTAFGYNVIHLPVSLSPNIVAGREVIPGMCSPVYVEEFEKELRALGIEPEDDPEYQGRVLANFPQDSIHTWIPLAKIKAAVSNYRRLKSAADDQVRVAGLDVAGEGDDETVFCVLEGPCMLEQHPFRKMLTPETIGWAKSLIEEDKVEAMAIDYGFDPGVTNMLEFDKMPVTKVLFGETSPSEKYGNFGTYMWALVREAIMKEEIGLINDPILIYQLSSRRVERMPNGKVRLESKKKSSRSSPDRADALVLAWYQRMILMGGNLDVGDPGENESAKMESEIMQGTGRAKNRRGSDADDDEIMEVGDIGDIGTSESDASEFEGL
jgi:hypothetical protein